jgi:microcystin-dependent protein
MLAVAQYPVLFSWIGYSQGGSGPNFKFLDWRDSFLLTRGPSYPVLTSGGKMSHVLTSPQMPRHNHSLNENPHSHSVNDFGHAHSVSDFGHAHSINDPGHNHNSGKNRAVVPGVTNQGGAGGAELSDANIVQSNPIHYVVPNTTGISVNASQSNVFVNTNVAGVSVAGATTGANIGFAGGTEPVPTIPKYNTVYTYIKVK